MRQCEKSRYMLRRTYRCDYLPRSKANIAYAPCRDAAVALAGAHRRHAADAAPQSFRFALPSSFLPARVEALLIRHCRWRARRSRHSAGAVLMFANITMSMPTS